VLIGEFVPSVPLASGQAVSVSIMSDVDGAYTCTRDQDSDCGQVWRVAINNNAGTTPVCDLKGKIVFATGAVECRDIDFDEVNPVNCKWASGEETVNFTITIGSTSLCADTVVDATKDLHWELATYEDADYQYHQSIFSVGSWLYFALNVGDTSTIDSIMVTEVKVRKNGGGPPEDTLYSNYDNGTAQYTLPVGEFNITQDAVGVEIAPGQHSITRGMFKLTRALTSLTAISADDQTASIDIVLTFDISYHGNSKKRTITSTPIRGTELQHFSVYFDEAGEANTQAADAIDDANEPDMFEWFGGSSSATSVVASMFLLVCVVASLLF